MIAYWFLFSVPAWMAIAIEADASHNRQQRGQSTTWRVLALVLVVAIGFRFQVGGDWFNYLNHVYLATWKTIGEVLRDGDPAYGLLNYLGARWGGIYFVNLVSAALFSFGLLIFCRQQPRPWLALLVAIPYLVIVVAMGYTRQGVAIGLAMVALASLSEGKMLRYFLWLSFAATFHKSAVILVPLAIFPRAKRFVVRFLLGVGTTALLYILLVQENIDALIVNYVEAEYSSGGAAIRIAMNAIPSAIFLLFRRRFGLSAEQLTFWSLVALGGLVFIIVLMVSPSSTAVDRVALYWIPVQMFVFSRLPDALSETQLGRQTWTFLIIAYSAAVLYVWLAYSSHAFAWLPYQFAPFASRTFWS